MTQTYDGSRAADGAAWPVTLAVATVLGTLASACMMPSVGLGVVAAATMARPRAVVTVVGIWLANQLLGFTLLGYPATGYAVAWGLAIGAASVAALLVARAVLDRRSGMAAGLATAFLGAFVAYEALLFGFALVAGGVGTFTPAIVLRILGNDALWGAGLMALHLVLSRAAPRWFAATPKLQRA